MAGNSNACALAGVVFMTIGCIFGIIGIATTDWITASTQTVYHGTSYANRVSQLRTEADCRVGLWEHCCTENTEDHCVNEKREVRGWLEVVRIMLVVFLALLVLAIVLEISYIFKSRMRNSYGCRIFVGFFYSITTIGNVMLTISYAMKEYTEDESYFNDARYPGDIATKFSWSFYLALVGSLLNPLGVFFICTGLHDEDDSEGGPLHHDDIRKGYGIDTPM